MPVRDVHVFSRRIDDACARGNAGELAAQLVDVAVAAAVVSNTLELVPRQRYVADTLARELARTLDALDAQLDEISPQAA